MLYFETGGGFWLLKEEQSVIGTIGLKGIDSENRIGEIKRFSSYLNIKIRVTAKA